MTAAELQDLIVATLVRANGGTRRDWRMVVGAIRVHDRTTNPHCNWSVAPHGRSDAVDAVETVLDRLRLDRPFVTRG